MDKLKELTPGEKLIGGSGLVLFIASFLPWFGWGDGGFGSVSVNWNGWDAGFFWGGLPALLGLALAGLVAVQRFTDVELPDPGSVTWGTISLGAGALAAFLVLLKLLIGESVFGVSAGRKWGLFVAAIAAVGVVIGGFLRMQEDKAGAAPAGPASPPPPPSPPPGPPSA